MKNERDKNVIRLFKLLSDKVDFNAEFELITTAKQTDSRYGDFRYTRANLQEMADNFNGDVVGTEIAVDLNHDPESIALAWIVPGSMRVGESSKLEGHYSLYARLHRFTPEGEKMIKTGAIRYFSIEIQHKFEKFVGEVKKTFKNVIRGLALTNRPVIKDMMPTFSERDLITKFSTNMETLKLFLAELKNRAIVSLTDKNILKEMVSKLNEEEQAEVADDVKEVEAKPEEEKEEEKEEETKEEEKEEETNEELAETKKQLAETKAKADRALTELRKRDLSEKATGFMLSDTNKGISFGLIGEAKDELVNFMMSLSDKQVEAFNELWKKAKAVDFSEKGVDAYGNAKTKTDLDKFGEVSKDSAELDAKVKEYAEKNKVSYAEAFAVVAK